MKAQFGVDTQGVYSFNKTAKTITFSGMNFNLSLNKILLINNATANTLIYNFADSSAGATSFVNNVLTLDYDTTSMNNTDILQIWVDIPEVLPMNVQETGGPMSLLSRILNVLLAPVGYDRNLARQRVTAVLESGTVTTVSTVSTITTFGGAGRQAEMLIPQTNLSAWADCVRARIT
jgi:hypothetical protein